MEGGAGVQPLCPKGKHILIILYRMLVKSSMRNDAREMTDTYCSHYNWALIYKMVAKTCVYRTCAGISVDGSV